MIRLNLRLRRRFIIIWCLCLWGLLAVFPPAYESYYPTPESRETFLAGMQANAGMSAVYGPLEAPASLGQLVAWEAGGLLLVLGAVMAVLMVTGLHRKSEDLGYTELQLSTGISRLAPASAALAATAIGSAIMGLGCGITLAVSQLWVPEMTVSGAVAFGATTTLAMIGSALLAQTAMLFVSDAHAAGRVGLLTVALSFLVRALADTENIGWLNWLSPLGWKTVIAPYLDDDLGAAALVALLCAVVAAGLLAAERTREYDTALIRLPRRTRHRARRINGVAHLTAILTWATILTWVLVISGLAWFLVALTGSLSGWMETDESIGQVFDQMFGSGDMKTEFIVYVAKLLGILVATTGIQTVMSYRSGEKDGTVDLLRSTGIQRWVPFGSVILLAGTGVLLATVGLLAGSWLGLSTQDSTVAQDYDTALPAAWSQAAPALLLTAIAVAIVGLAPRMAQFAWAPVAAATILTLFGPLLQAPQWLIDLSPFEYVVRPDEGSWAVHGVMGAAAILLILLGLYAVQRREVR